MFSSSEMKDLLVAMTVTETDVVMPLQRLALSGVANQEEPQDGEQDVLNLDQPNQRHSESDKKKTYVLIGSAILQLPIWGMVT